MELLPNTHISPETAYVVDDYPYGFRLRCKIRYWLEYDAKRGVRFVSQTTNPKRGNAVWNKPKASTYARFGGAMFLDDEGHCRWDGLSEYTNGAEASAWRDTYGAAVPEAAQQAMNDWVEIKLIYDDLVANGMDWQIAGKAASIKYARQQKGESK